MWQFNFAGFFDIFRITKCAKVILLQSATDCYCKVRQVLQSVTDCYYKGRQVLQSVTDFITNLLFQKFWKNVGAIFNSQVFSLEVYNVSNCSSICVIICRFPAWKNFFLQNEIEGKVLQIKKPHWNMWRKTCK